MQYCVPDVPRSDFVAAVNAEGIPLWEGYVRPIYLEPMYQHVCADCPVTERMHFEELIFTNVIHAGVTVQDLDDVVAAFGKVYEHYR